MHNIFIFLKVLHIFYYQVWKFVPGYSYIWCTLHELQFFGSKFICIIQFSKAQYNISKYQSLYTYILLSLCIFIYFIIFIYVHIYICSFIIFNIQYSIFNIQPFDNLDK